MNFEDLQKAWQNQEAPEVISNKAPNANSETILDQVKKLQRKVIMSNIMMSVCLAFTCVYFAFMWYKQPGESGWYNLGMILIFSAMLLTPAIIWLRAVPWGKVNPDLNSRAYIEKVLKSLRFRQSTLRYILPVYMFVLFLGINFIYLEIFQGASLQTRILVHLGLLIFMILIGALSLYYHRLKYKNEFEPVINELKQLQQELG